MSAVQSLAAATQVASSACPPASSPPSIPPGSALALAIDTLSRRIGALEAAARPLQLEAPRPQIKKISGTYDWIQASIPQYQSVGWRWGGEGAVAGSWGAYFHKAAARAVSGPGACDPAVAAALQGLSMRVAALSRSEDVAPVSVALPCENDAEYRNYRKAYLQSGWIESYEERPFQGSRKAHFHYPDPLGLSKP